MDQIILYCMAFGALVGGIDHLLGNRFGLGNRFEEAFGLLGSIGRSMAGIICLAPVLSQGVKWAAAPVFHILGMDPGILGGFLAIDMGGYQMAMDLARNPQLGQFAGIVLAATFGCTVVFTIPVGMASMEETDRSFFTRGLLVGLSVLPVGILAGGLVGGIAVWTLLWNCLPVFTVSGLLLLGLMRKPVLMARGFGRLAEGIQKIAILGLTLGAVSYMTGKPMLPALVPLEEAMEVVCSIAIMMLGSMPLAELLQRLLRKPFGWVRQKTGLNETSTTALLIGMVSVVPALAMFPRMDPRGKVINGAFAVCAASTFAAHLGFTLSVAPEMAAPLLAGKLLGGFAAVGAALALTRGKRAEF